MYLRFILLTTCFFFINTESYAYLDPGTSSIIIQAILGAIAAGAVTIKIYWNKLKSYFKKKDKK